MTKPKPEIRPGLTIGEAVRLIETYLAGCGMESPRLEAGMLVGLALGTDRAGLLMAPDRPITERERSLLVDLCLRRASREPMAYLTGMREFHGLGFRVSPDVLVPRPETEMLVDFAIAHCAGSPSPILLDVGTGSGCIAIAVACAVPGATVLATDLSPRALAAARANGGRLGVLERLLFSRQDLLSATPCSAFDIILSNPPYIPTGEMDHLQPEVAMYEPRSALDGGPDGLGYYRRLVADGPAALRAGGWLAVEVGMGQADEVAGMMGGAGFADVVVEADLAGVPRLVAGRR